MKIVNGFVNCFCKKAPSYVFDWVLNTPLQCFVKLSFAIIRLEL